MNPNTRRLSDPGQSLWLDNITREMLKNGTLAHHISDLSVTGLTSNPTIFEHAIGHSDSYDEAIRALADQGESGEKLFFSLAPQDLTQAADLFLPIHARTGDVDDEALAVQLQREGAEAFSKSWNSLPSRITEKNGQIATVKAK